MKNNSLAVQIIKGRNRKIYVVKYSDTETVSLGWKTDDDKKPVLGAYIEFTNLEMHEIIGYLLKKN